MANQDKVTSVELANSIRAMIDEFFPLSPKCCIYRAPKRFRQFNEKAFSPSLVSIGPFYHGKKDLESMERCKVAYVAAFCKRTNINLGTLIKYIKERENDIRNCYAEIVEFNSDDFVKMILLDTCFIIEVIWRFNNTDYLKEVTDHLSHPRIIFDVMVDMILLENQLPFFVLEGLFDLAFLNSTGTGECFIYLCLKYFRSLLLGRDSELAMVNIKHQENKQQKPLEIKHLLDLLRKCHAPSMPRQNQVDEPKENSMWKASELQEAGMVIKHSKSFESPIDICYTIGVLEIPKIKVQATSERVLRNLIVLEACLYYHDSYISDYVHFMDNLIDTSKDVQLLIRNGIIESFSSDSQEVANLFNNLHPYCTLRNYLYYGIEENVNAYCMVPWHRWRASFKHDYCKSPWMIASSIAATILLILAFVQTVCSIISVS